MTARSAPWKASTLILSGRYADSADLTETVRALSAARQGSAIILATFSGYYLLPSVSRVFGFGDEQESRRLIDRLKSELESKLRVGGTDAVIETCTNLFMDKFGHEPALALYGNDLNRSGDSKVAIFAAQAETDLSECQFAENAAACALGSRNVAFHRENAIDLSTTKIMQEASELLDITTEAGSANELTQIATKLSELQTIGLLEFARRALSAYSVVTYDAPGAELKLHHQVGEHPPKDILPRKLPVDLEAKSPLLPEEGASIRNIAELANLCIVRGRRYTCALADGRHWCVGYPFGAAHPASRPAGAACVVFNRPAHRGFGAYELALLRILAIRLARVSAEAHLTSAVTLVSGHLRAISALGNQDETIKLVRCSKTLKGREDVRLAGPTVVKVLSDIAKLSGAMSVTCRLLAGNEKGPLFSRHLFRMHCTGSQCDTSPDSFGLDDAASSVNAWVAVNGRPVYLRSIEAPTDDCPYVRSPDLGRYVGLERVTMYRSPIRSELCVPVFSEDKLVGTINLEADKPFAFDVTAETVDEFAQLVGVVLLESRRQISVGTMSEARGFLGRRHELEARLINFGHYLERTLKDDEVAKGHAAAQIQTLRRFVYLRQGATLGSEARSVSIDSVLRQASETIEWTYKTVLPVAFVPDADKSEFAKLAMYRVSRRCADALLFGVSQALLNVRKYGSKTYPLVGWTYPVQYNLGLRRLGGRDVMYIAILSSCRAQDVKGVEPNFVFREPIEHAASGRTSLGTFLAGEIMRRAGGSGFFRIETPTSGRRSIRFVTAEFGVPLAEDGLADDENVLPEDDL